MNLRLALGLAAAATTLAAQSAAPAIPISSAPLRFHMPQALTATLPNGLRMVVIEDHRTPLVTVTLDVSGAGGFFDPAGKTGLAAFTAEAMNLGSTSRSAAQVADTLGNLGASVNFHANNGALSASLAATGLRTNFDQWFGLAVDLLLHPDFPAAAVAQLQQQTQLRLRQMQTQPATLLAEHFNQAVFGAFPPAVSPTAASLSAVTRDDLVAWHAQRYGPQHARLAVMGDFEAAAMLANLRAALAPWPVTGAGASVTGAPHPTPHRQLYLIDRPGAVQTNLELGGLGLARTSPDYCALLVLNEVLGRNPQSRLFTDIRETKGLAYAVSSNFTAGVFAEPWSISGNFRTAVTGEALAAILAEVDRLRDQPVPAAELERAQQVATAAFALGLESPPVVLDHELDLLAYGLPATYWDTYPAAIAAVTAADLQRVARQYFNPDALQIVVVGDAAQLQPQLAPFGPVQIFDAEGKPRSPQP